MPLLWNWTAEEVNGYIVALLLYFAFGFYIYIKPNPKWYRKLLVGAVVTKGIMSWAYIALFSSFYGGGDFMNYINTARVFNHAFIERGWEAYASNEFWETGSFIGTTFVAYITSIVGIPLFFSLYGVSLVFAALGLIGQILFIEAFANAFPLEKVKRYAWIVVFAPSLSFWPSVVGKDALLLLSLGVIFHALSLQLLRGRRRRRGLYVQLALGMALMFFVRPQVAAVVGMALGISVWLSADRRWSPVRVGQAVVLLGATLWVATAGLQAVGIESLDSEGVAKYVETKSYYSGRDATQSGVRMEAATNPAQAMVNVLFRPFLWEAGSPPMMIAAFEVIALWGFVLYRLKTVALFVRQNRRSRVFVAAMAFLLLYSVGFGMSVSNLGIIARQRIHVVPVLVMLVSATPRRRVVMHRASAPGLAALPV